MNRITELKEKNGDIGSTHSISQILKSKKLKIDKDGFISID